MVAILQFNFKIHSSTENLHVQFSKYFGSVVVLKKKIEDYEFVGGWGRDVYMIHLLNTVLYYYLFL